MAAFVDVPFQIQKPQAGLRLDAYLVSRLPKYSRAQVQRIIEEGKVIARGKPAKASLRLIAGETVLIRYPKSIEAPCRHETLTVLHEDDDLLAVDKPGDMLSHPTDRIVDNSVTTILKRQFPDKTVHLAHRLDRETSGVLLLAKSAAAARAMYALFSARKVKKTYVALVRGLVPWDEKRVDAPLGREGRDIKVRMSVGRGQPAVTEFRRLASSQSLSLVEAKPETGRLHQIRVHLASLGHPVVGDKLYIGDGAVYMKTVRRELTRADLDALGADRQMLHARAIEFPHPATGERLSVEAPLPDDFADLMRSAGLSNP